jgi:hypothetical protein
MIANLALTFNIDAMGVAMVTIIVAAALIMARIVIYISEHEYLATEKNITVVCYIFGAVMVGLWLVLQFGINPIKLSALSTEMLSNLEGAKVLTQVGAEMLFMYPIIMHFLIKSQWLSSSSDKQSRGEQE